MSIMKMKAKFVDTALTVTVDLWDNNSSTKDRFRKRDMQYDTGSFMTVVDYSIVERYGYELIKPYSVYDPHEIKCIGGYVPSEYTIIPNIRINGIELGSLYACVVDFDRNREQRRQIREELEKAGKEPVYSDTNVKAILGLNFIRGFCATIDFGTRENAVISLQPKFDLTLIEKSEDFNPNYSIFGSFYSEFTFRRDVSVGKELSEDAQIMLNVLRDIGYVKKVYEDKRIRFSTKIQDIGKALDELAGKGVIDRNGDVYTVK